MKPGSLSTAEGYPAEAYRAGDFQRALDGFAALTVRDPEDADAWHGLGRAAIWTGDTARARGAFGEAARLDPEGFVVPTRIATVEFIRIASEVWRSIPQRFASRMTNTIVAVELLPDPEEVAGGLDPDVLGVYEGGTALEDEWFERIVLFQRNHETVCGSLGDLCEEVRRTLLHEVGHHFGMEDAELPF